jgi:hypothetical protein
MIYVYFDNMFIHIYKWWLLVCSCARSTPGTIYTHVPLVYQFCSTMFYNVFDDVYIVFDVFEDFALFYNLFDDLNMWFKDLYY